jgi:hypothetical protein
MAPRAVREETSRDVTKEWPMTAGHLVGFCFRDGGSGTSGRFILSQEQPKSVLWTDGWRVFRFRRHCEGPGSSSMSSVFCQETTARCIVKQSPGHKCPLKLG